MEQPIADTSGQPEQRWLDKVGLAFVEFIKIVVLAAVTIVVVRHFLFRPFTVKGQSMEPTFYTGEYLIIDELSYRLREPQRGEVVVFRAPVQETDFYLKRIIGLPGEKVKIQDNKIVIINEEHPQGIVLDETYLTEDTNGMVSEELAANEYFVVGDNRDASFDSRRFGAIPKGSIVGRAWFRGFPFDRMMFFSLPNYNF